MNTEPSAVLSKYFFCIICALSFMQCRKSGEPGAINNFKRYPFERAHFTYEYSGDARGTEEIYIAGNGKYEAHYLKLDIFTPKDVRTIYNAEITRLMDLYHIDFDQRQGSHRVDKILDSLYHLDSANIPSPEEYAASDMGRNFFKNVGIDTIMGKPATRWQQTENGFSLWVWHSILLRKHSPGTEVIAKNIDTLWVVDTTKFSLPPGFHPS